jgi:hypothetical protein
LESTPWRATSARGITAAASSSTKTASPSTAAGDVGQRRGTGTRVCGARPPGAPSVTHLTLRPNRSGNVTARRRPFSLGSHCPSHGWCWRARPGSVRAASNGELEPTQWKIFGERLVDEDPFIRLCTAPVDHVNKAAGEQFRLVSPAQLAEAVPELRGHARSGSTLSPRRLGETSPAWRDVGCAGSLTPHFLDRYLKAAESAKGPAAVLLPVPW